MVVEPESYCWSSGRLVQQRDGPTWAGELQTYSSLEYVVRDGGSGLSKGIALVRAERPELKDGLDVFHTLYEGGKALRQTWAAASRALEASSRQQKWFDRQGRQGKSRQGQGPPLKRAWDIAEKRMDQADRAEQALGWPGGPGRLPAQGSHRSVPERARCVKGLPAIFWSGYLPHTGFSGALRLKLCPYMVNCRCPEKRSPALRGRNRTRDIWADGAPMVHLAPGDQESLGAVFFSTPLDTGVMP